VVHYCSVAASGWGNLRCLRLLDLSLSLHQHSRMSFADIRAKRQDKEAKSLVVSSSSSGSKPSTAEAPSEPLFGTLPSSTDIQSSPERGRGIFAKESFKKGEVEHHLTTSHTHPRAQVEPFSSPSHPSMSSLPKTWSISVRLASLLPRPQVSSAAHNARIYGIVMRCVLLSTSYVMVVICIE
jgi:hypothetical protein